MSSALILAQPAAAQFLVRKLYGYLIAETPSPPDSLLEPLAERFRTGDYDIGDLVGAMLRSRHFFSEFAYRRRIKSPVEYAIGIVRLVRPTASPRELIAPLEAMGQSLFAPPNVKGWPGGKTWLNSATVLARQNFAQAMTAAGGQPSMPMSPPSATVVGAVGTVEAKPSIDQVGTLPPDEGIVGTAEREKAKEPTAVVNLLSAMLLQSDIDELTRKKLIVFFGEGKPEKAAWQQRVRETAHALLTLPEFTLA